MATQNFKIKNGLSLGDQEIIDSAGNLKLPAGAVITTGGEALDALPDQTGQSGNYLTTDGTTATWNTITQYTPPTDQGSGNFLAGDGTYKAVTVPTLTSELTNDSGYITSSAIPTTISSFTNDSGYQTASDVSTAISNLVDSAPATLDTLNELAAALGDDPNFATTVSTQIGNKQDTLVSGTNIKTISGNSILGSGFIVIEGYA